MKDLTVAICVYNAEKYIEETLECIMAQTVQDFHLLIVNDCSTDNSLAKIKAFFDLHPRQYEIVDFEENKGIAFARNYALNYATSKYIIFIDSDDCPLPQLVEKEYDKISTDQELTAVSSWSVFVDTNTNPIKGGLFIGDATKESFINRAQKAKRIFLPIQTLFNREDAIKVGGFRITGFPEGKPRYQDYCEDLDLWTRLSDLYKEVKYIITLPEVLYKYRKVDGLSSNHYYMILKMDFVKVNLLRRRSNEKELTFIEFLDSISERQKRKYLRDASAADSLRNGVFYLKNKNFGKGVFLILKSIFTKPTYLFDKIISNSGIIKKKR